MKKKEINFLNEDALRKIIKNVVYKTLTNSQNFPECVLKENTSVTTPIIFIQTDTNLSTYNYCHIPEFSRYYYITNISSVRNGLWQLNLKVDVLMSYKDNFDKFEIIIERSSTDFSKYLNDDEIKKLSFTNTILKKFNLQPVSSLYHAAAAVVNKKSDRDCDRILAPPAGLEPATT